MSIHRIGIAAAILIAAALSFSVHAQDHTPRTAEMQVDGLVCAFCAQGISKRLKRMDATAEVFVSLENSLVAVQFKPGQEIADTVLRDTLKEAGYSVRGIQRHDESLDAVRARIKAGP